MAQRRLARARSFAHRSVADPVSKRIEKGSDDAQTFALPWCTRRPAQLSFADHEALLIKGYVSAPTIFSILRLAGFFTAFFAVVVAAYTATVSIGLHHYVDELSDNMARNAGPAAKAAGHDMHLSVGPILNWTLFGYAVVFVLGTILFVWAPFLTRFFVSQRADEDNEEPGQFAE